MIPFLSPVKDEESLCGTLGVAVHSARGLQQPACRSHDHSDPKPSRWSLMTACFFSRRLRVFGGGRL